MKKNPLFKKLKGFYKSPKDKFLHLNMGNLNQEELLLYELGIAITDWDNEHIENYGSFEATNLQLAEVLGYKGDTTVSRIKRRLIEKGYFVIRSDGRIEPRDFEQWQTRKRFA